MKQITRKSFKCIGENGNLIPFVPRANSVEEEKYHFEIASKKEISQWKKEYKKTGKCAHPCGHDEECFYMYKSVCDICGASDLF